MANCNENIAMVAGVNAGIIAELIKDITKDELEDISYKYGKKWCRCSFKTMAVYCPYLSIEQIKGAVCVMRKKGILSTDRFNESKFDHTNWYAFTEYGKHLLETGW